MEKSNRTSLAALIRDTYKLNRLRNSPEYGDMKRAISSKFADISDMPFGVLAEIGAHKILKDLQYYLACNVVECPCVILFTKRKKLANRLTILDNLVC